MVKYGDARVALVGFPSVGKSTFLSTVTKTKSEAASCTSCDPCVILRACIKFFLIQLSRCLRVFPDEFTTLTCIPGILEYKGATIQLLDLPGIIEGASEGKGRGRQVIAVARSADLILLMLDVTKSDVQRALLEKELEAVGIRLNKKPPDVYFKQKKSGGVSYTATVPLTHLTDRVVTLVLKEYKVHNCDLIIREDITVDQLIDKVEGNRQYIRCLNVYNKIDAVSLEEVDRIAREPNSVVVSCNLNLNLDYLVDRMWDALQMCRVYTKKPGSPPDFSDPLVLRGGSTVEDACRAVHRSMIDQFRYAHVWGRSTKHDPQRVGLSHELCDEDVMQIFTK